MSPDARAILGRVQTLCPDAASLASLADGAVGQNINEIAGEALGTGARVYQLVQWCDAQGLLDQLEAEVWHREGAILIQHQADHMKHRPCKCRPVRFLADVTT